MVLRLCCCISLLLVAALLVDADKRTCFPGATINLTNASRNDSGFMTEADEFFPRDVVRDEDGTLSGCLCDLKPCLPLCPPKNATAQGTETMEIDYSAMPPVYKPNFYINESLHLNQSFHGILSYPCPGRFYALNPTLYRDDKYYLMANGSLIMPRVLDPSRKIVDAMSYCLHLERNATKYTPMLCGSEDPPITADPIRTANYVGALVSVPFLLATIFVYSVIQELRNIHGLNLRCYLASLVSTYVTLGVNRIPSETDINATCLFLGFTIYLSFIASLFWQNVMCFDIWWRFGGYGPLKSSVTSDDRKKFIRYSVYAWGCPILLTTICIVMEFTDGIGGSLIKPDFRSNGCWFGTKSAEALYYYGPVGVIITANIFLFILTSLKIFEHKRNVKRHLNRDDSNRHKDNKQWFNLYVKLFIVMGICWSTEVISGFWDEPKYLWYITDMVNALQGIVIFVILVCKKKICRLLKLRYNGFRATRKDCTFETRFDQKPVRMCEQTTASI